MSNEGNRLLSLIERIERMEEERAAIASDIRDIYAEAKTAGFDPKAMRQMIRERRMDPAERAEYESMLEIYRAALGMLAGTPLGQAARRRLMRAAPPAEPAAGPDEAPDAPPPPPAEEAPPTPEQLLKARAEGAAAAKAGKMVLLNPYPALSPLRSAWDEGWCAASGGDGMDIPAAFRRSKPKPAKGDEPPKGH